MSYDQAKIDDAVLALLAVFSFDGARAWKGFDFGVMDRLHEQRFIDVPKGRAKSVWLTPEGLEHGRAVARELFGDSPTHTD